MQLGQSCSSTLGGSSKTKLIAMKAPGHTRRSQLSESTISNAIGLLDDAAWDTLSSEVSDIGSCDTFVS